MKWIALVTHLSWSGARELRFAQSKMLQTLP